MQYNLFLRFLVTVVCSGNSASKMLRRTRFPGDGRIKVFDLLFISGDAHDGNKKDG